VSVPSHTGSAANIIKHAQAKSAQVSLSKTAQDELKLTVTDNGNGFDIDKVRQQPGLGLRSMEERTRMVGGIFHMESQPGKGSQIVVTIYLFRSQFVLTPRGSVSADNNVISFLAWTQDNSGKESHQP
jgi:signal transduction histidine kinase